MYTWPHFAILEQLLIYSARLLVHSRKASEGSKFAYIKSVHLHQYTKDEIAEYCILVSIIQK